VGRGARLIARRIRPEEFSMPLTPADVHNVAFKKPPIGKRGYDEEEVDAFLDEVERELTRLIDENGELRNGRLGPSAATVGDMRHTGEMADIKTQMDRIQREKAAAEQAVRQLQIEIDQMRSSGQVSGGDGEQQALRVLMMAQRTADEHVGDARREADKLLGDARTKSEELTRDARAKAEALERDARQRHQEVMGSLDSKRTALQKHIEELKQFEREYRTRLKAYLESQLRDLEGRGQGLENELSRGGSNGGGDTKSGSGLAAAAAGSSTRAGGDDTH
jgi:DivIVA domain-containing protein